MATMDIFEGDAFTIVELTRALENIPYKPALLSGSNLFSPRGVRSRTVVIESRDGTLSLIPFSERGSAYEQQILDRREMRAFVCRQFKKQDVLWASEIQSVRDFGSESATQQVQTEGVDRTHVVRAPGRVAGERQGHDGHEGQREGAEQPQQRAHPEHQGGDHRGNHHDHGMGLARGQPGDVVQQLLGVALTAPEARAGDVRVREHEHRHSGHRPHHGGGLHEPQHLPVDRVLRLPRLAPAVARGPLARGVREARHHADGEQQPAHDHRHRDVVHGLHHGQAPPHERPGVRDLPGCGRAAEQVHD